ncbi:MAG: hypothetical protein RLZZ292_1245 [Bacteroidota bacterium]
MRFLHIVQTPETLMVSVKIFFALIEKVFSDAEEESVVCAFLKEYATNITTKRLMEKNIFFMLNCIRKLLLPTGLYSEALASDLGFPPSQNLEAHLEVR